jgi:hypothetical protein
MLQVVGWTLFSLSIAFALCMILCQITTNMPGIEKFWPPVKIGCIISHSTSLFITGFLGVCSEIFIIVSLFVYEDEVKPRGTKEYPAMKQQQSMTVAYFLRFQVALLNYIFGPDHPTESTRRITTKYVDQYKDCPKKWDACLKRNNADKATGKQYLVIGVGFLGGRLVKRLLERGETKIRLFDIAPSNMFAGNPNVEFCRGDVTKYEQILNACKGVDTVYCTFAIIRFMVHPNPNPDPIPNPQPNPNPHPKPSS